MFEKEAIDRANRKYPIPRVYNELDVARNRKYEEGFKDGAEFGYNKANDWCYVKDELPAMDVFVYLWKKGKDFPVVACRHIPYGQKEWVWNCEWGSGFSISQLKGKDYLWKEIVLPKEIKND